MLRTNQFPASAAPVVPEHAVTKPSTRFDQTAVVHQVQVVKPRAGERGGPRTRREMASCMPPQAPGHIALSKPPEVLS